VRAGLHTYGAVRNLQQNRPAEQHERASYKQNEAPTRADTSARMESVAQDGERGPQSAGQNHDPSQEAIAYYTFWLTWFTGIMAVGTLGLFVVTLVAALAAKESADALINAEKAWPWVEKFRVTACTRHRPVLFASNSPSP
jgi:hypothetical protein